MLQAQNEANILTTNIGAVTTAAVALTGQMYGEYQWHHQQGCGHYDCDRDVRFLPSSCGGGGAGAQGVGVGAPSAAAAPAAAARSTLSMGIYHDPQSHQYQQQQYGGGQAAHKSNDRGASPNSHPDHHHLPHSGSRAAQDQHHHHHHHQHHHPAATSASTTDHRFTSSAPFAAARLTGHPSRAAHTLEPDPLATLTPQPFAWPVTILPNPLLHLYHHFSPPSHTPSPQHLQQQPPPHHIPAPCSPPSSCSSSSSSPTTQNHQPSRPPSSSSSSALIATSNGTGTSSNTATATVPATLLRGVPRIPTNNGPAGGPDTGLCSGVAIHSRRAADVDHVQPPGSRLSPSPPRLPVPPPPSTPAASTPVASIAPEEEIYFPITPASAPPGATTVPAAAPHVVTSPPAPADLALALASWPAGTGLQPTHHEHRQQQQLNSTTYHHHPHHHQQPAPHSHAGRGGGRHFPFASAPHASSSARTANSPPELPGTGGAPSATTTCSAPRSLDNKVTPIARPVVASPRPVISAARPTITYRCLHPLCGKTFSRLYNLKSHHKTHLQSRPFHCGFCNRSFIRKADCERHMRIHTGEKPFRCATCGTAFTRQDGLVRHLRGRGGCSGEGTGTTSGIGVGDGRGLGVAAGRSWRITKAESSKSQLMRKRLDSDLGTRLGSPTWPTTLSSARVRPMGLRPPQPPLPLAHQWSVQGTTQAPLAPNSHILTPVP